MGAKLLLKNSVNDTEPECVIFEIFTLAGDGKVFSNYLLQLGRKWLF